MIEKIIDGISTALNEVFGDDYEIYTESILQGLQEPCFSIVCLKPKSNQVLGKRYLLRNQFCIHYFPKSETKNQENLAVIEKLYDCLALIIVDGDLVWGTEMDAEIVDDVVSFMVNYNMHVYKESERIPMETYSVDTDVKG